jgi:hypothetical protein
MTMRSLKYAEILDAYRVVPRVLLLGFGYLVWFVVAWFTELHDPTTQQTAFVSAVVGITAPITAFYFNTGRKWRDD